MHLIPLVPTLERSIDPYAWFGSWDPKASRDLGRSARKRVAFALGAAYGVGERKMHAYRQEMTALMRLQPLV